MMGPDPFASIKGSAIYHSGMIADDLARLLAGDRPRFIAHPEVLG